MAKSNDGEMPATVRRERKLIAKMTRAGSLVDQAGYAIDRFARASVSLTYAMAQLAAIADNESTPKDMRAGARRAALAIFSGVESMQAPLRAVARSLALHYGKSTSDLGIYRSLLPKGRK